MNSETQTEVRYVAAPAADPGPVIPVLIRNPLVALVSVLIGPILGLFRRRESPTAVVSPPPPSGPAPAASPLPWAPARDQAQGTRGSNNHASEGRTVAVRAYTRHAPAGRTAAQKGGQRHG